MFLGENWMHLGRHDGTAMLLVGIAQFDDKILQKKNKVTAMFTVCYIFIGQCGRHF